MRTRPREDSGRDADQVRLNVDCPDPVNEAHLDGPRESCVSTWTNPPHKSHLCHACGHIWRPADVATNGVLTIKTAGKNDSPRECTRLGRDEALRLANQLIAADPYTRYSFVPQNAVVEKERAEKYARSMVVVALTDINPMSAWPFTQPVRDEQARCEAICHDLAETPREDMNFKDFEDNYESGWRDCALMVAEEIKRGEV